MSNNLLQQNWFISKDKEKFGPYLFNQIIDLLQKNKINKNDLIWSNHLDSWLPISYVQEFSQENLEQLSKIENKDQFGFSERKNKRIQFTIPIVGHNHKTFFTGLTQTLSCQGSLIQINSPYLEIGEKLKLHVENVDSFNLEASIKSKIQKSQKFKIYQSNDYVVEFLDISPENQQKLIQIIESF